MTCVENTYTWNTKKGAVARSKNNSLNSGITICILQRKTT